MKFWIKSILLAAIVTFISFRYSCYLIEINDMKNFISTITSLSASMLGFILASLAILASISNTAMISNMKKTGHFDFLLERMFICLSILGVVTLTCIVMSLIKNARQEFLYILIFLISVSAASISDVLNKFWVLLKHLKS